MRFKFQIEDSVFALSVTFFNKINNNSESKSPILMKFDKDVQQIRVDIACSLFY